MKINPLFWSFFQIIRVKFFHKKLWSGQPEAINTLLDISHHKNIIFSFRNTGNTGQNCLLDQITILIFVNCNFRKFFLIFFCSLSRNIIFLALLCVKSLRKTFYQAHQFFHIRKTYLHICCHFFRFLIKIIFLQTTDNSLHLLTKILNCFYFFFRYSLISA